MLPTRFIKALWIMSVICVDAYPSGWSDDLIAALSRKNVASARQLILAHAPGCGFVSDYSELERGLRRNPEALKQMGRFRREFRLAMDRAFSDACLASFELKAGDTTASAEGRMEWLQVMVSGRKQLNAGNQAAIPTFLLGMLRRASTPGPLKAAVIASLDKFPSVEAAPIYFQFLVAGDSSVRNAAYKGLAEKVRVNRQAGDKSANQTIYKALLASDSASQSLDQVKVIATIGEPYARDYLLAHCSGNRARMAALFYRDDSLTHPGILQEAVRLLAETPTDAALRKALRYGTKDPDQVIGNLLAGQNPEKLSGMRLLDLFPEYVPAHDSTIRAASQGGDGAMRSAAGALIAYLPPSTDSTRNAGGND